MDAIEPNDTKAALLEFYDSTKRIADSFGRARVLQHDDYTKLEQGHSISCFVLFSMANGFTRNLISELNKFLVGIIHADAWCEVAQKREESRRMALIWEFAEPALELSVGRPYSIKNHFAFAGVHLLHQASRFFVSDWKDDLESDRRITHKTLLSIGSRVDWKGYQPFLSSLEKLNDSSFQKETFDMRHRTQHQFRSHFEFGLTPYFEREKTPTGMAYDFRMIPALKPEIVVPELYKQHLKAADTFDCFWRLLLEMQTEIEGP